MDYLRNNKQNQAALVVGLAVLAGVGYVLFKKSDHSGRKGFPCYCKSCEVKIVDGANNGDAQAQQMLRQLAIFQDEQQKKSTLKVVVFILLVVAAAFVYKKYTGSGLQRGFEQRLSQFRGR